MEKKLSKLRYIIFYEGIFRYLHKRYHARRKTDMSQLSLEEKVVLSYYYRTGKKMKLDEPKTFNEKLQWLKVYWHDPLSEKCADKYYVREYINQCGLTEYLPKLYGVYQILDEIDFEKLPNSFVIKTTHDSGGVYLVREKNTNSIMKAKDYLSKMLDRGNYSVTNYEWVYQNIKPQIIVEEIINTSNEKAPSDFKFFCFHGEPKFLFVGYNRDEDIRFNFYDLNWKEINVVQGHLRSKRKLEKPDKFDEMLDIARTLSKPFPHVRIDLYYEKGNIYIGELTFFHFSGCVNFHPNRYDKQFGEFLDISKINR